MRRRISIALVLLLLISLIAGSVSAASPTPKEVKRAIAIVFDNSGSMYSPEKNNDDTKYAWCRATYAMEAFATMMNPDDVMQIYPMYEITVGSDSYSADNPLTVTQSSASRIRDIYTPNPLYTPIETITTACQGLEKVTADEKWLIVLTDGTTFYKNNKELKNNTVPELEKVLTECNQKVNVMYLGIGSQAAAPSKVSGNYGFYSEKAQSSTEVLAKLTSMCNTIFGRDTLPNVGKTVSFDVSMSKLILFVQGSGIQNVKLGDSEPASSSSLSYATKGGGGKKKDQFGVDQSLQGTMVIYNDLDAGEYALSYEGTASSVVCYYEPDVDLTVQLQDAAGNPVDVNSELMAGAYSLKYSMVDKYGKEVTSSLLGQTHYEINYEINGASETVSSEQAGKVDLNINPNDVLKANIKATYLGGYTLNRNSDELGWPSGGLKFAPPPAGMLEARLTGGASAYKLSTLPDGEVFRVEFVYNGQVLTGAQLEGMEQLQAKIEGGNMTCQLDRDDTGYFVKPGYNGTALQTDCGDFVLSVTGVYRNEDDQVTNMAQATAQFSVSDDSRALEMSVSAEQTYYQLSQLAEGKPVLVYLTYSGQKLTKEELDGIQLTCKANGLTVLTEPDYESSGFVIRMDPENPPQSGAYVMELQAAGVNEVGREQNVQAKQRVEFGTLPMLLRILIPIVILLAIIGIIIIILNIPVLPKAMDITNTEFVVDGELIPGKGKIDFQGGGKQKGEIKIYSPKSTIGAMAEQAMFLTVVAVSPLKTKSKQRKAKVMLAKVRNPISVTGWKLKTATYVPDPEKTGGFVNSITGKPGFKEIEIGNNTEINVEAQTEDASIFFKAKIVFK